VHAPLPSRGASPDAARRAGTAAAPSLRPHALGTARRLSPKHVPVQQPAAGGPAHARDAQRRAGGAALFRARSSRRAMVRAALVRRDRGATCAVPAEP
jgi:hypothetical protein